LFIPIGYNRSNVEEFKSICKILTEDIFREAIARNRGTVKTVIFAAGLPASGKSTHLASIVQDELIYDGTINNDDRFIRLVQFALDAGYTVEVFIYSSDPGRAFKSNLERGDTTGRYVPVAQYEKVANSINKRANLIAQNFQNRVKIRNFEHTDFEGKPKRFSQIKIDRNELERIAAKHKFPDSKTLYRIVI
jgi:Zeta toxin